MPTHDIVNLTDRAQTAIDLGESHFREFKSYLHGPPERKTPRNHKSVARDIGQVLVAFANADGGELLVGVEDDGRITGIPESQLRVIPALLEAPKSYVHSKTPLPPVRTATIQVDEKKLLYFSTPKSISHIHLTSDGRCLQRRDLEILPIPVEDILLDRRERESREFDREYVDGADATHLDADLVQSVATQISPGMSNEKCLQYLDLAEYVAPGLRIKRAALLLFGREPSRWHPRLQVRIMKVEGTQLRSGSAYNVKSDTTVSGNILHLVEDAWEALRPQLVQTRLGHEARFETTVMYPELACREALVNAVAHRDYSEEGRGIEIFVFDDRMEVRNPGALLSTIKIVDLERLEGVHQSRNSSIARVLREAGFMRELGEGIRRMFELMRQNELTPPEFLSSANSFSVTLHHKTIYTEQQRLWLEQFESYGLDREQKAIVVLGIGGNLVSPQDIWDSLGIVDTEHYRKLIESLQRLGVLHSVMPRNRAQNEAKQKGIPIRQFPRFRISTRPPPTTDIEPHGKDKREANSSFSDSPDPNAELWIGNLPSGASEKALLEFFSRFGEVQNLRIPKGGPDRLPRGFGYVEFGKRYMTSDLLKMLDGKIFDGKRLVVRAALAPRRRHPNKAKVGGRADLDSGTRYPPKV